MGEAAEDELDRAYSRGDSINPPVPKKKGRCFICGESAECGCGIED
jgi:hypothetical protein